MYKEEDPTDNLVTEGRGIVVVMNRGCAMQRATEAALGLRVSQVCTLTWLPVKLLKRAHFVPAQNYSKLVLHLSLELIH